MDLCFEVQKLFKFSSNTGKLHFDVLVQSLIYIRDNDNLVFKYYPKIEDLPLSDLLVEAGINTENHITDIRTFQILVKSQVHIYILSRWTN